MYQSTLLKSILTHRDPFAVNKAYNKRNEIFTDKNCLALFELIAHQLSRGEQVPDESFWLAYFRGEKDSPAKSAYESIMSDLTIKPTEAIVSLLESQIAYNVKTSTLNHLRESSAKIKISNTSDIKVSVEQLVDKLSELSKHGLDTLDTDILVYHHPNSERNEFAEMIAKDYALREDKTKGYYKFNTGITPLDNTIGGIHSVSFVGILGFVKNGKSFLARQIAYNVLTQGKNVMFVTIEMSKDSILHSFLSLHANNTTLWGYDKPKIKTADIRSGTLSPRAKEFYLDQVVSDLSTRPTLGTLYITQPESKYTPSRFFSDVRILKNQMDIDLIVIDYPGLMSPERGIKDRDSMNDIFRQLRHFGLTNHIPIIFPVQCNRVGYDAALKHKEHLFDISAIGDFSAIEKECTDVISILTTPEMRQTGQAQIQHLLSRESGLCSPISINADFETGVLSTLSAISKDEAQQLIEEIDL